MDKKSIIIISLLLVGLICMSYYQVKTQAKLDTVEQNYKAAEDSLNVLVLQNHELLYEKEAYILREAELNARIGVTEDEVKEIKKKLKSSLDYMTKIDGLVKVDTIYTNDTIYYDNDTLTHIKFDYNDLWLSLSGVASIKDKYTYINSIQIPLSLQTGLTSDNNIFVKTDNPYVNITSLEGAIINEKKFNWNFKHELQIGVGFQYGLFNGCVDFGPQIGYGFIIEF